MAKQISGIFDKVYKSVGIKSGKTEYRYRFYWYPKGSKRRKFGYSDAELTKEEARANAKEKLRIKLSTRDEDNSKLTIKQLAQKYVDNLYKKEKIDKNETRPSVNQTYKSCMDVLILNETRKSHKNLSRMSSKLRDTKMDNVKPDNISNFIETIYTIPSSKTGKLLHKRTIKKYVLSIRKLLAYAKTIKCIDSDTYMKLYKATLLTKEEQDEYLTKDQTIPINKKLRRMDEEKFREFMKSKKYPSGIKTEYEYAEKGDKVDNEYKYYMLLSMLFYSGARISEVVPLTIEDIGWEKQIINGTSNHFNKAYINFNKSYSEKCMLGTKKEHRKANDFMKTEASPRKIPIYGKYARELKSYKDYLLNIYGRDYKGLLFPSIHNRVMSLNGIQRQIDIRIKRLNDKELKKFSPHDFRASRVSIFLEQGLLPKDIFWYFGHNSEKLVMSVYNRMRTELEYKNKKGFANEKDFGNEIQEKLIEETILRSLNNQ